MPKHGFSSRYKKTPKQAKPTWMFHPCRRSKIYIITFILKSLNLKSGVNYFLARTAALAAMFSAVKPKTPLRYDSLPTSPNFSPTFTKSIITGQVVAR